MGGLLTYIKGTDKFGASTANMSVFLLYNIYTTYNS